MGKDFHSRCDNKGSTIALYKIKDGDCIGGFTNAYWDSDDRFFSDIDSFLFNLSSSRKFTNTGKGGISCMTGYGPGFANKKTDELRALEPFNGER
jgi:hypothetical protein